MATRCETSATTLCSAFNAWPPAFVGTIANGTTFLNSIRKSNRTLTEYGKDCVMPQRSKLTYNLEKLKTIARFI